MKKYRTVAVLALGIVCIAVGLSLGQNDSVLAKAITVCLECIGIG